MEEVELQVTIGFMKKDARVEKALRRVIDPELGINMVDLGLFYGAEVIASENKVDQVKVTMTLTTPGCPLGGYFVEAVKKEVEQDLIVDQENVFVEVVWDPPWVPDMMTEESKAELGMD